MRGDVFLDGQRAAASRACNGLNRRAATAGRHFCGEDC
jgi:hypothetical protein